jgi:hypothetical protein
MNLEGGFMILFDFMKSFGQFRVFLGKTGLLPRFLERSGTDRRVTKDRRVRSRNEYLLTEGADRRFQPDRRRNIERRAGNLKMDDIDFKI